MARIDILCPVFREELGIQSFHARLSGVVGQIKSHSFGFIYVVDPAPDRTEEVLCQIANEDSRASVIVMSRRFGHQAALMAGIDASEADALIMLDSDGQHPPELIGRMIHSWENGAEVVQALRQDGNETGLAKRKTSQWFYQLLTRISSVQLLPGTADFRLLDQLVVKTLRNEIRERNAFLRGLITWLGFRTDFVEFKPAAREHGASNYRASTLLNFAITGISSFSKFPLRMAAVMGIVISFLSMAGGIAMIVNYLAGGARIPGWATLVALISFFGGLQLLFTGIVGEYIGQIFDEVKQRPRYIISREHGRRRGSCTTNSESET